MTYLLGIVIWSIKMAGWMIPTLNTVVMLVLVLVPAVVPNCAPQTHFFEEGLPLVFSVHSKRHHSFPSAFRSEKCCCFSIHKPWQESAPKQLFKVLPHEPPKYLLHNRFVRVLLCCAEELLKYLSSVPKTFIPLLQLL